MTRVVLVHGAIERQRGFDEVVSYLPGVDVVTYDRQGHGGRWKEGPASLEADVDDLLDRLEGQSATVVGHSLGGLVALGAALRQPRLCTSVGLYETAMPWADWWTDDERAAMLAQVDRNMAAVATAARSTETVDSARLEVAWASCRRQVLDAFNAPYRWQDATVPVTTGRGGTSDGYSARDASLVAQQYGSEPSVLEGAGHRAHRSHPEAFAGFIASCISSTA
jgi:pimeloyl-ACP methyl ester carboxylesterase